MLSPADAALVARDPALPGLAATLDAAGLARRAGLGEFIASYLRYKPARSCVAGLVPADGGLGALAVMTYPPARYAEICARAAWREGPDPALFLNDICTVLVPLRHERKLKGARKLADPERRARYFGKFGLDDAAPTLLRYKPGRRLVLRADLPSGGTAILKSHARPRITAAAAGARHADRLAGVPLLAVSEARGIVVSRWIDGGVLAPGRSEPAAFHATGAELARLHRAAPRPGRSVPAPKTGPAIAAIATLLPGQAEAAAALARAIRGPLGGAAPAPCVIHGDFSPDQVVLSGGQPTLIDWDRSTVGDPGRDLGSFLARLDIGVVEGEVSRDAADAAADALLQGYADTAGALPRSVAAHWAGALLGVATEGFRRRHPDWFAEAEALLARVAALLPEVGPAAPAPTRGLAAALGAGMGAKVASALGAAKNTPVRSELLRHKPGRRALIRYELEGAPPVLGKLRAKGPDSRTPALHRALRAAGLDGRAPDRVGVPEPLAAFDEPPLWLQRMVPGRPLTGLLGTGEAEDAAARTGRALATLHGSGVETGRTWSMADELAVLDRALREAAAARPDLLDETAPLARQARAALGALDAVPPTGIHRDFYPDQVLVERETVWIVDLDLHATGDPLIDVGNFLAHLTELGLREHADPARLGPEMAAFLAGYEVRRGTVDCGRLRTLHWVSLIRHVALSQRIPGRAHTTDALLALCAGGPAGAAFSAPLRRRRPAA